MGFLVSLSCSEELSPEKSAGGGRARIVLTDTREFASRNMRGSLGRVWWAARLGEAPAPWAMKDPAVGEQQKLFWDVGF